MRPDGAGRYMIVMGERRYRAHQHLETADILCQVSKVDDAQLAIDAIIENDQRVDVEPLEQARSYQRMIDVHGFTVETLAIKIGKPPFRIEERLRLLNLTEDCQFLFAKGQINREQAWYLCQLGEADQAKLLRAIRLGQCNTTAALKAITTALKDATAQSGMFGPEPEPATEEEKRAARTFEARVEQVAAMLRASIRDNDVVAVRQVNPDRAAHLADLLAAMQIDIKRLETGLRVAAVQQALAA